MRDPDRQGYIYGSNPHHRFEPEPVPVNLFVGIGWGLLIILFLATLIIIGAA